MTSSDGDGPDPSGFQEEPSQDEPDGAPRARPKQSYAPYQPYPKHPYPADMDGVTPKPKHSLRTVVILAVCLVVAGAAGVVYVARDHQTLGVSPSVEPASIPPATLPLDISYGSVVEAIDIDSTPALGPIWDAADTDAYSGYMDERYYVSPCGVFVTAVESTSDYPGHGTNARLVGYEISTGAKAWSVPLQDVSGLKDPYVSYSEKPSYTPDCQMVVTLDPLNSSDFSTASIMVDLSTGVAVLLASSDSLSWCEAAGAATAACYTDRQVQIFGTQGVIQSIPVQSMYRYPYEGDLVVDGLVWTEAGYIDPSTGAVRFGTDTLAGWESGPMVTYHEANLPGGYASGVAVRIEGDMQKSNATCTLIPWDTTTDKGLWDGPASLTCDMESWTVAGSALVVTDDNYDMWAYSLSDGSLLWDKTGRPYTTGWTWTNDAHTTGITSNCILFEDLGNTQEIVSIATGADLTTPFPESRWTTLTMSDTMGYAYGYGDSYTRTLAAYNLNGTMAWSLPLPGDSTGAWTFATGGTMYVVWSASDGPTWVSPLVTG